MFYIYILIGLVISFIVLGLGKIGIELYVKNKISFGQAYFITWSTLLVWQLIIGVLISLGAFHFHPVLGWIVSIVYGLLFISNLLTTHAKDVRHSMDLATERKYRSQ